MKGTEKLYFLLLKKMPLVCTKNVTFLFFQSSTYNMLKNQNSDFCIFFRHFFVGPSLTSRAWPKKISPVFPVSEYMGLSPTSRARRRFHGPVTALLKAKAHIYGDGPTKK